MIILQLPQDFKGVIFGNRRSLGGEVRDCSLTQRKQRSRGAESFLAAILTTDRHGRAALTLAQPQKRRALAKPVRESPWLTISSTPPLPLSRKAPQALKTLLLCASAPLRLRKKGAGRRTFPHLTRRRYCAAMSLQLRFHAVSASGSQPYLTRASARFLSRQLSE